jgi:hypothetical protein
MRFSCFSVDGSVLDNFFPAQSRELPSERKPSGGTVPQNDIGLAVDNEQYTGDQCADTRNDI